MAIRSSRRNKTARRLTLHPVNPSSFYFVPFLCVKRTRQRVAAPPRLPRRCASRSGHRLHGRRPEPPFSFLSVLFLPSIAQRQAQGCGHPWRRRKMAGAAASPLASVRLRPRASVPPSSSRAAVLESAPLTRPNGAVRRRLCSFPHGVERPPAVVTGGASTI